MCVRYNCTFTITEEKINEYALLSGDFNPIHLNQKEAESAGFPTPIAHGMLTMGLALDIVSVITEKGIMISTYEMQFLKPVFRNDTIHIFAVKKQNNGASSLIVQGLKGKELVLRGKICEEDISVRHRKKTN
jgi:3-hydroxybutyryl-CoA dehydratase